MTKMRSFTKDNLYGNLLNFINVASIVLLVVGLAANNNYFLLFGVLLLILHNLVIGLEDFSGNIIFLFFHLTFSLFLVGRFVVNGIFGFDGHYEGQFDMGYNDRKYVTFILFSMFLSLYFVLLGFYYRKRKNKEKITELFIPEYFYLGIGLVKGVLQTGFRKLTGGRFGKKEKGEAKETSHSKLRFIETKEEKKDFRQIFMMVSGAVFYATIIFRIVYLILEIKFIREVGYHESYLVQEGRPPRWLNIVGDFSFAAYFFFLATMPKLRATLLPSALYILTGVLELLRGVRNPIMLNIFFVTVYYILRSGIVKIPKKVWYGVLIAIPILLVLFIVAGEMRGGVSTTISNEVETTGLLDKLLGFFYKQGVSARMIGDSKYFEKVIPKWKFYSFGEIIDFVKFSILGRILPGITEPTGQSVAMATQAHQLSHRLAFLIAPEAYLNRGLGVGSSYIAELYVDFSWIGIVLGSFVYGYFMKWFIDLIKKNSIFIRGAVFMMVREFFFTPRAGYSSLLFRLLTETQILIIVIMFALAFGIYLVRKKENNRRVRAA